MREQGHRRRRFQWRRWNNVLHRDLGYLCVALTVVYAVSGIAVNHIHDWNPNYKIEHVEQKVDPIPLGDRSTMVALAVERLGLPGPPQDSFRPDPARRAVVRESLGLDADDVVVVSVSRLHAQKGVLEALRGFAAFAGGRSDARYLVVGDGPARGALEAEAEALLPSGSYRLVGAAERREVPGYLDAADVFLFANLRSEVGLPLNVLEAAAVGLPLVLSRHVCSDVEPPLTAECVDPARPGDIAEGLARAVAGLEIGASGSRVSRLPEGRSLAAAAARYDRVLFPENGR